MEAEVRRSADSSGLALLEGEISNARCVTVSGYEADFLEILTLLRRRGVVALEVDIPRLLE
ncbi:hypothetical protein [Paraburkholderia lacunae]|uniref:hypothetical protein n=1 Tax=Paraburkholderia lacunae TaxID=2211104 RepID=UPI001058E639|nr:hypothetical protein [Paraburkholderia lacunae]